MIKLLFRGFLSDSDHPFRGSVSMVFEWVSQKKIGTEFYTLSGHFNAIFYGTVGKELASYLKSDYKIIIRLIRCLYFSISFLLPPLVHWLLLFFQVLMMNSGMHRCRLCLANCTLDPSQSLNPLTLRRSLAFCGYCGCCLEMGFGKYDNAFQPAVA